MVMRSDKPAHTASRRDRVAAVMALATLVGLASYFFAANGTAFLMPGPLSSAHGSIEQCSACHTKSGDGKLSWLRGLALREPHADSKACLTCHKVSDAAFNAHGASAEALNKSTEKLAKIATDLLQPMSARAQSAALPMHGMVAGGLACASCHQEHQGVAIDLKKISNEQCQSCHVAKFDSFDGHHPKFDDYPFKRRTRIIYDHAGHFEKHFPEVAKKDPSKRIPAACSTCHNSSQDKRIMAVASFEETCSGCHLDQITGKERVSGPKGIAFLSLPGLDLQSLKKRNAAIGEWPEGSDAALTPFMKAMISRTERGRTLIKTIDSLNLQDLTGADDDQIKAGADLIWEVKTVLHLLISGKTSEVIGDLSFGGGAKLSAARVAELTASIPRDVLIAAQQQWLPNLAAEIGSGPGAINSGQSAAIEKPASNTAETAPGEASSSSNAGQDPTEPNATDSNSHAPAATKLDPPACVVRIFGQCLVSNDQNTKSDGAQKTTPVEEMPAAMQLGVKGVAQTIASDAAHEESARAKMMPAGGKIRLAVDGPAHAKPSGQSDDLLFPTEEERREIDAHNKKSGKAGQTSDGGRNVDAGNSSGAAAAPPTTAAPAISVESDADPETWAEYGGWYRQDYAIFYRPTGHKDKFISSWLTLTGPRASNDDKSLASAVFDVLTGKEAQGACTKCHSIDDMQGKGRLVNFSLPSAATKLGGFTKFVHEPHFSTSENRGCLSCHNIAKGRPYLKSYEQGDPHIFASNFGALKKDGCQACHTNGKARQDCLLCHTYHVDGVITPMTQTKNPQ